ncbi:MAG: hypothetical protein HKP58_18205 [Desulfatitalea sp.]|nr:hypothetical protein [Desulfatitalea sp.]NNK02350.1 hypothetical protein [Desulfatitalea sp.]
MNSPQLPDQLVAAPVETVMPQLANHIYALISLSLFLIVAIVLFREGLRRKSLVPILFLLGGTISYFMEPFFDYNICIWYPEIGTDSFYRLYNKSIPIWPIGVYGIYMGGGAYWVYRKMIEGTTSSALWKMSLLFFAADLILEIPGLQLGLYYYYGPQAFKIGGIPLWMVMANTGVPFLIAASIFGLRHFLTGYRIWLIPLLVFTLCLTGEVLSGWPMWFTLNSGAGLTGTRLATIPVFCFSALLIYIISSLVCADKKVDHPVSPKLNPAEP